jgi:putative membrane protein insertion efficiency factor
MKFQTMAARALLRTISFYQKAISPLSPPHCRFYPSCSAYAYQAVERFGALRGLYLAVRRVLRCQPLHKGGFDPVPEDFHFHYSPF